MEDFFSSGFSLVNTSCSLSPCCRCLKPRRTRDTVPSAYFLALLQSDWSIPDGFKLQSFCLLRPFPYYPTFLPFMYFIHVFSISYLSQLHSYSQIWENKISDIVALKKVFAFMYHYFGLKIRTVAPTLLKVP